MSVFVFVRVCVLSLFDSYFILQPSIVGLHSWPCSCFSPLARLSPSRQPTQQAEERGRDSRPSCLGAMNPNQQQGAARCRLVRALTLSCARKPILFVLLFFQCDATNDENVFG